MDDLLNEEEFVQPQPYNPWKRFLVFYGIAILHMFSFYWIADNLDKNIMNGIIGISIALLFLLMPFIMILHKKKMIYTLKKTIVGGICLLLFVYFCAFIATDVIENGIYFLIHTGYLTNFLILCGFLGYGLLCSGIIILIINRKRKNSVKHAGLT